MTNSKRWMGICLVLFGIVAPAVSSAEPVSSVSEAAESLILPAHCNTNCTDHCTRCTNPCAPLFNCETCFVEDVFCYPTCLKEKERDCRERGIGGGG